MEELISDMEQNDKEVKRLLENAESQIEQYKDKVSEKNNKIKELEMKLEQEPEAVTGDAKPELDELMKRIVLAEKQAADLGKEILETKNESMNEVEEMFMQKYQEFVKEIEAKLSVDELESGQIEVLQDIIELKISQKPIRVIKRVKHDG